MITLLIILTSYMFVVVTTLKMQLVGSQSLLHLHLAPDRHQHLPQHHPLPLLCAQLQNLQAHSQSGLCVLHGGHPQIEFPDLQSEKQGCQGHSEQTNESKIVFTLRACNCKYLLWLLDNTFLILNELCVKNSF